MVEVAGCTVVGAAVCAVDGACAAGFAGREITGEVGAPYIKKIRITPQ